MGAGPPEPRPTSSTSRCCTCAGDSGRPCRLTRRPNAAGARPDDRQPLARCPLAPVSSSLAPGRSIGEAATGSRADGLRDAPGRHQRSVPGHRAGGVPPVDAGAGAAGTGDPGHLPVLGILYESFIHPFTILPGAAARGLWGAGDVPALFRRRSCRSTRLPGIIMLVGLVKKNGIIMIDFSAASGRGAAQRGQVAGRRDLTRCASSASARS